MFIVTFTGNTQINCLEHCTVLKCQTQETQHETQSNNYHCVLEGLSGYCTERGRTSNIGTESIEMRVIEDIIYDLGP